MAWIAVDELREFLRRNRLLRAPRNCPVCNAKPGEAHVSGCDVERCSACGGQRISCECGLPHDSQFARWTGFWPGDLECIALGMVTRWEADANDPGPADLLPAEITSDLNRFVMEGWHKVFSVKPTPPRIL